jgi:RNA polymerase sigma-B factor
VIEGYLPLVESIARRFAGRGEQLDDLVQVGCIGLINAVDRFDVDRGSRLGAFAGPSIAGEIQHHLRDRCTPVRVPRRLQEQRAALARAVAELAPRLGRAPTIAELAAHSALTPEQTAQTLEAERARVPLALAGGDDDDSGSTLALTAPDDPIAATEDRAVLFAALRRLDRRTRRVVVLRYFQDLSQADIARELGLSQIHVSRLLRGALATLRGLLDPADDVARETPTVARRTATP